MPTICDTHVLIFWADAPQRLSPNAREHIDLAVERGSLACCDISFWEIASLCARGRLQPREPPDTYMRDIVVAMGLNVLPITPEIAFQSQAAIFTHKDPADRIIGATALVHAAPLITSDQRLRGIEPLHTIW